MLEDLYKFGEDKDFHVLPAGVIPPSEFIDEQEGRIKCSDFKGTV
jgi:hypothetical protein